MAVTSTDTGTDTSVGWRAGCPVLDFDHRSPRISHHRHDVLAEVRRHQIFYTEAHGGYWVVAGHELAKQVLHDREHLFSTARTADGGGGITIPPQPVVLIPAEIDPPEHTAIRKVINPLLGKGATDRLRPMMHAAAAEVLDAAVAAGEFDAVHDVGHVFPTLVILRYLGVPESEGKLLVDVIQQGFGTARAADPGQAEAAAAKALADFQHVHATLLALFERRRTDPADDVVSALVNQDDMRFDEQRLFWTVFTLIAAGIENVAATIANVMLHLQENPDLKRRLIDHPELISNAVEEYLRYFTPGPSTVRHVQRDTVLGEVPLTAGDRVLVWLPGTNFDPAVFDDPDTLDVRRHNARRQLAFGEGVHFCAGHYLGKVELEIFLAELFARMPDYRIDRERAERFSNAATMYGWWTMPATTGSAG
jgi:cytochrome P450